MVVLEHQQGRLFHITNIRQVGRFFGRHQQPATMGVEKSVVDIVGIFFFVDVQMMAAMVGRPIEHRAFKSPRTKKDGKPLHKWRRLERPVRIQPVIPQRDAHARGEVIKGKQQDLKQIEPIIPNMPRHDRQCQEQGRGQKGRVRPIHPLEEVLGGRVLSGLVRHMFLCLVVFMLSVSRELCFAGSFMGIWGNVSTANLDITRNLFNPGITEARGSSPQIQGICKQQAAIAED